MKAVNTQSISKPVILLKILQNGTLAAINSESIVRILNPENLSLVSGFKVGITHKRYKNRVLDYSYDSKYLATLSATAKESLLYNTQTKKITGAVKRHQGEVSCIGIDPKSRYMFSCGDDGKTFAMDVKSGKLMFTMSRHADSVNDVAFSENGNWVATASYDRKISLFNLVTMMPKEKYIGHSAPVMKLKFLTNNRLLSIDRNSVANIWDIYQDKIIHKLEGVHDSVTQICVAKDENIFFLSGELGYIMLYQLDTYEQLSQNYIKFSSIVTALEYDADTKHLLVCTEDGFIYRYNIYEGMDKLRGFLQHKQFKDIQEEVKKNPVLKFTQISELVANFWENSLNKAKILLQKGDKKIAQSLLADFQKIPAKNTIIKKLFHDYENFEKFKQAVTNNKLVVAYNLAATYPTYKESKVYKILESRWKKTLVTAQKYALDPKGMTQALELLNAYRGISEKTIFIQDVLKKGDLYKRFRNALGRKDFKMCFELAKRNPFLKEFPEYDSLIQYSHTLNHKVEKLLVDGDIHNAMKLLRQLVDFPEYQDKAEHEINSLDHRQKFFNAVQEDNLLLAYNMLDTTEELLTTKDGQRLQEEWSYALENAEGCAAFGDVKCVQEKLEKYMKIQSKYRAIATIFAWTYMVQLEQAFRKNASQSELENGIKNYVLNFGLSEQIENFDLFVKKKYPESKLNLEFLTKGSLSMWRPAMIVKSILE